MRKTWIAIVLVLATVSPAIADRDHRRDRRDDRRDRRDDRRQDRADRRGWIGPRSAPPPVRAERKPPRRGHVWIDGRWDWNGGSWVWVGGRYERERRGQRWRPARWDLQNGVYVNVDGGWIVDAAVSAPPPVRAERWNPRAGYVWIAGNWEWRGGQWTWVAGHYERERRGQRWREARYEQRDGAWITVQGGWVIQ